MEERDISTYSNHYFDLPFENVLVKYRRAIVLESITKNKHQNILEIGCGLEPLFTFVSDFNSYTLIEPSKAFYDNANYLVEMNKIRNVQLHNEFFEDAAIKLKGQKYDLIIASGLLHEISDKERFFDCLLTLCDKDTVVHINVPNANSFHRLLALKAGMIKTQFEISDTQKKLQQSEFYSLDGLRGILHKKGFVEIESGSYFVKPFTNTQMQELIRQGILTEKVINGLFELREFFPLNGAEIFFNVRLK